MGILSGTEASHFLIFARAFGGAFGEQRMSQRATAGVLAVGRRDDAIDFRLPSSSRIRVKHSFDLAKHFRRQVNPLAARCNQSSVLSHFGHSLVAPIIAQV